MKATKIYLANALVAFVVFEFLVSSGVVDGESGLFSAKALQFAFQSPPRFAAGLAVWFLFCCVVSFPVATVFMLRFGSFPIGSKRFILMGFVTALVVSGLVFWPLAKFADFMYV